MSEPTRLERLEAELRELGRLTVCHYCGVPLPPPAPRRRPPVCSGHSDLPQLDPNVRAERLQPTRPRDELVAEAVRSR